jgi:uncharacterized protein YaeQ
MSKVSLALLERGEVIGLEECETKGQPDPRRHTVICKQSGSVLLYMSHENFASRVLSSFDMSKDIMYENLLK